MDFAAGLALAFMKILPIAFAIMGLVWISARVSVALHRKKHGLNGADDAD